MKGLRRRPHKTFLYIHLISGHIKVIIAKNMGLFSLNNGENECKNTLIIGRLRLRVVVMESSNVVNFMVLVRSRVSSTLQDVGVQPQPQNARGRAVWQRLCSRFELPRPTTLD